MEATNVATYPEPNFKIPPSLIMGLQESQEQDRMGDELSPHMALSSNVLSENWGYKMELPDRMEGRGRRENRQ